MKVLKLVFARSEPFFWLTYYHFNNYYIILYILYYSIYLIFIAYFTFSYLNLPRVFSFSNWSLFHLPLGLVFRLHFGRNVMFCHWRPFPGVAKGCYKVGDGAGQGWLWLQTLQIKIRLLCQKLCKYQIQICVGCYKCYNSTHITWEIIIQKLSWERQQ